VRKNLAIIVSGLLLGFLLGIVFISTFLAAKDTTPLINPLTPKKVVIGFLPYWLLDTASSDYSKYITALAYFGLRVDQNGNIQKLLNPQQEEPGWNALRSGKLDSFFSNALKK
jgi:hypothetical protein